MNQLADRTCDICGEPAVVRLIDTKEREPTEAERLRDPEWKAAYHEVDGPKRAFCDQHKRKSIRTPLPGRPPRDYTNDPALTK